MRPVRGHAAGGGASPVRRAVDDPAAIAARATEATQSVVRMDPDLVEEGLADRFAEHAAQLQAWHDGGRVGPRPPGRLRPHRTEELSRATRLWAVPIYRLVDDPDGRPLRLRRRSGRPRSR